MKSALPKEWSQKCHPLIMNNLRWCEEVTQCREHPHIFCDIEALNPGGYKVSDSYEAKKETILSSWLQETSPCLNCCDRLCRVPSADFGVSGLPCTDMSRAGLRQKRHGPTNGVYMTHAKYNLRHRTPLFVLECTPDTRLTFTHHIFVFESTYLIRSFIILWPC